jgi:hypothetical protein
VENKRNLKKEEEKENSQKKKEKVTVFHHFKAKAKNQLASKNYPTQWLTTA